MPITLVPGANVITLVASDPLTGRDSAPVRRTITVVSSEPSVAPGGIAVDQPADGATLIGPVSLAGTAAPAAEVTATASLVAGPAPSFKVVSLAGPEISVPPLTPVAPAPLAMTATAAGAFNGQLSLPLGTWDVSIGATGAGATVTRRVIVAPGPGLHGSLAVAGATSYLEIDEDGQPKTGISGRNADPGTTVDLSATSRLRIRVGNAVAVKITINGLPLGPMGVSGAVVEWEVTRL